MAKPLKKKPSDAAMAAKKRLQFTMLSRLSKAMEKEFSLQSLFKLGYRNKEDVSNLPAYTLVVGSQNVLTNAAEQVAIRNGYQYDGPAGNQNTYGVDSSYDFDTHGNGIQNLRKWGGNLEVRYTNPSTKAVTWINILSTLVATNVCNFTNFWDNTLLKQLCLFVNGDLNIWRWTGAVASFASATSSTITVQGTKKLTDLNFDGSGNLLINGATYAYTSAGNTANKVYNEVSTAESITFSGTPVYAAQKFTTAASAFTITQVTVDVNFTAAFAYPFTVTASLYTDNAGVPGTKIASSTFGAASIGTSSTDTLSFTFSQAVTGGTNYHIVFSTNLNSGVIQIYTGSTGSVGTHISNDGLSWTNHDGFMSMTVTENDSNTTTFTGVTPTPTGIAVGDAIIQPPSIGTTIVTGVSGFSTFDLISSLRNQVYYGSKTSNSVFITKVNSFTDASFTTPVRVVGEGAVAVLDAPPVSFAPAEQQVYISAGREYWYVTQFTLSSDLAKESFQIARLKTAGNQGAQSQSLVARFKNSIVFMSFEQIFNSLGYVKNILADVQMVNVSDSIKFDIDSYDFTNGSIFYDNYFIYLAIPSIGVVRMYNVQKKYWEAPQLIPVSRFYHVTTVTGSSIYGHSGTTNESYQLFVPSSYDDIGNPINAVAAFPYVSQEGGSPTEKKFFNKHYTEGYIAGNTTLTLEINYDFGAFSGTYSANIVGSDPKIIFNRITDGSLGKNPLGTQPIGAILNLPNTPAIPKFRVINTFAPVSNYESQIVYSSNQVDGNWAILRFGSAIGPSRDLPVEISE